MLDRNIRLPDAVLKFVYTLCTHVHRDLHHFEHCKNRTCNKVNGEILFDAEQFAGYSK